VLQLAKHGPAKIFLAARNESRARDAINSVTAELSDNINIEWLPLDTASLESVKEAAQSFNRQSSRLDILVLNAGIMATPPTKSASGHDLQLSTNHIGHFLLTKLLMPTLQKTAAEPTSDVRVISISSEAHQMAPSIDTILSTEKLIATGAWTRYGASKAANILFAAELSRRYPNLTSVSIHPGMIKTDLWKYDNESNSFMKYFMMVFGGFIYRDTHQGAYNQLWAAAGADKSELQNGGYYTPVGKKSVNKFVKDVSASKRLWDWTESELEKAGY
jgi:NAD(P)-dependent dehydrogenase (short-subunit alcohol dehydrogenase family)